MRILRSFSVCLVGLFVGLSTPSAQSNEQLDSLLAQASARADSVSYVILVATKSLGEERSPAEAFSAAIEAGFLAKTKKADEPMTIEELSFFIMKALRIPGGVQWSILPNPRAAYQELAYRKVINRSGGPARLVAGDEVLRTLSAALALQGEQK